jgi:hypothetical protein
MKARYLIVNLNFQSLISKYLGALESDSSAIGSVEVDSNLLGAN